MAYEYTLPGGPILSPTRNPFNWSKVELVSRDITKEWLLVDEIANHLNLFGDTSQADYLEMLGLATRQAIEDIIGVPFADQTWRVYYGGPTLYGSTVCLDMPESSGPVTINSLKYWTDAATPLEVTIDPSTYYYDASGNKLVCTTLPASINSMMTAPVTLEYTITANSMATYPVIKQAGFLLVTHFYNQRCETVEKALQSIPFGVNTLLRNYRQLVM